MINKKLSAIYKDLPFSTRMYVPIRQMLLDFERMVEQVPENVNKIQELGCGYGLASFLMAQSRPNTTIESYDIAKNRIDLLGKINPYKNLKFYAKNVIDINTFDADVIIMTDLLHHLTYIEQRMLLNHIRKTAKDDVFIIVKDMDRGKHSFRQAVNYTIDIVHAKGLTFFYHTQDSFQKLFEECGFRITKQSHLNRSYIPLNHIVFCLERM